jgi:phosphonopyruvate decarboxylase
MKTGALATIGARAPANLVHVVLDSGVHDSTGGQATVSPSVDFAAVALACGYASGTSCDTSAGFEAALADILAAAGPHLVHLRIRPGSMAKHRQATRGRAPLPGVPRREGLTARRPVRDTLRYPLCTLHFMGNPRVRKEIRPC